MRVSIKDKKFYYGNQQIFFCGAWPFDYRGDYFGNGRYEECKDELIEELDAIQKAGGNLVLMDIHKLGKHTPVFDNNLFVTKTDNQGSLASDLRKYLDEAKKRNIFVHLALASFAFKENKLTMNALYPERVQSYIDNCLIPIVNELKGHPALLAYCVFSEPEFNLDIHAIKDGPFKSDFLGENWFPIHVADIRGIGHYRGHVQYPNEGYTFEVLLRYINMLADAIHRTDPGALVSGMPRSATTFNRNQSLFPNTKDFYSDEMLLKAGGRELGYVDFLASREKPWGANKDLSKPDSFWDPINLIKNDVKVFQQSKPIMIGYLYIQNVPPGGETVLELINAAYKNGYSGITLLDFRDPTGKFRKAIEEGIKQFTCGLESTLDRSNGDAGVTIN